MCHNLCLDNKTQAYSSFNVPASPLEFLNISSPIGKTHIGQLLQLRRKSSFRVLDGLALVSRADPAEYFVIFSNFGHFWEYGRFPILPHLL